jgi:uncharacterized protein HemY
MRKILFFLFILVVAVFIGLALANEPSFVLFQFNRLSIAFPLWLFILLVVIFIYLSWLFYKILRALFLTPQKLKNNIVKMQQRRAIKRQMRAIDKKITQAQIKK